MFKPRQACLTTPRLSLHALSAADEADMLRLLTNRQVAQT